MRIIKRLPGQNLKEVYIYIMKSLPGNKTGPQWNNSLFDDLAFIKQHLRYPMSKKTLPSAALIGILLFFISRALWMTMLTGLHGHVAVTIFLGVMMAIIFVSGIQRYYGTLRFHSIPTPYFATENLKLVETFLRMQQLNLYRHPKAPEVFQILSRPLGNSEQREVMIFIADDKRILINSHFINQKWVLSAASKNANGMARQLQQWISQNSKGAPSSQVIISDNSNIN
jgi:hypothetical protein